MKKRLLFCVLLQILVTVVFSLVPLLHPFVLQATALTGALCAAVWGVAEVFAWRQALDTQSTVAVQREEVVFGRFAKVALWSQLLVVPVWVWLTAIQIQKALWTLKFCAFLEKECGPFNGSRWQQMGAVVGFFKNSLYLCLWQTTIPICCGAGVGVLVGLLWKRRWLAHGSLLTVMILSCASSAWNWLIYPSWLTHNPFLGAVSLVDLAVEEKLAVGPLFFDSALAPCGYVLCLLGLLLVGAAGLEPKTMRWRPGTLWRQKKRTLGSVLVLAGTAWLFSQTVLAPTHKLQAALPARKETTHFVLHYDPKGSWANTIEWAALEHELRYQQLRQKLGTEPNWPIPWWQRWLGLGNEDVTNPQRISVYLFNSKQQAAYVLDVYLPKFNDLSWVAGFARPWQKEMFLLSPEEFATNGILTHELAHVFEGNYEQSLLHIPVGFVTNRGMSEGTAEALAGHSMLPGDASYAFEVSSLQADTSVKDGRFASLFRSSLDIFARSNREVYELPGLFCAYLTRTRGWAQWMEVYRRGGYPEDFAVVYNQSLAQLRDEWIHSLTTQKAMQGVLLPGYVRITEQYERGVLPDTDQLGKELCRLWRQTEGDNAAHCKPIEALIERSKNLVSLLLEAQQPLRRPSGLWDVWVAGLLFQTGQSEQCAATLERVLGAPLARTFPRELRSWALFLQGVAWFQTRSFEKAHAAFAKLLHEPGADQMHPRQMQILTDWLERCAFAERYFEQQRQFEPKGLG